MTPELLAQIAAVIIAISALYKAWGGAKKDDLDSLRQIIKEQGERLTELECENKTLRSEAATYRTENAALHERLNLIRADLSTVQADNLALKRENEALRAEVGELRTEVEEYRTGKRRKPDTGPLAGKEE